MKTKKCYETHTRCNQNFCSLEPGNYYVSVADGPKFNTLLGPFKTHKKALAMVEPVRQKAEDLNPRAFFYAFGTVKMADDFTKPGLLNPYFQKEAA